MIFAKLSTAKTILFGPVLDSAGAEYTGAVVADVKICKNNGTPAALNGSATLTHKEVGLYELALTQSDISEVGVVTLLLSKTTYVAGPVRINVVPALVYDSLVGGSDNLQVDAIQVSGTTQTARDLGAGVKLANEAMGGTSLILTLGQLVVNSSAAGGAIDIDNSAGPGISVTGNIDNTGAILVYNNAALGEGVRIGSAGDVGLRVSASSGPGVTISGYPGVNIVSLGSSQPGVKIVGTDDAAILLQSLTGNNDAMKLMPSGTGKGINGTFSDKTGYSLAADQAVNATKIDSSATAAQNLAKAADTMAVGTVDTGGFAPTATEFEANDITEATTDHFKGLLIKFLTGPLAKQGTKITAYSLVSGRGHFTVDAMTEAPASGNTFEII